MREKETLIYLKEKNKNVDENELEVCRHSELEV